MAARLGHSFADLSLAVVALTHKSYANEHRDDPRVDNERLEFLGDAVVDLAVSHRLMERFPNANEGELSKMRALIVHEEGLAEVARTLALGELLLLGRGEELTGGRTKSSVLADALEAVIGAVYLGSGMPAALAVADRLFGPALVRLIDGGGGEDSKTLFQEAAQERFKLVPRYRVVAESGPDHDKLFDVEVAVGSEIYARASGRSKKEAEQAAAREALAKLRAQG